RMKFAHEAPRQRAGIARLPQHVGQQQGQAIEANVLVGRRWQRETVGERQLIGMGAVVEIVPRPLGNGKNLRAAEFCEHHDRFRDDLTSLGYALKIPRLSSLSITSLAETG